MVVPLIIFGTLIFLVIIFAGYFIGIYNGLVRLKNNIRKAWANIDVLLKQRHDELPKLVEVCKGYMKYEKEVFETITKARSIYQGAQSIQDKAQSDNMISGALKTLFAVSENYPELKANEDFKHLQTRVSSLESEIADRREFYNESTNNYNIKIQSFPDMVIAGMMGFKPEELFKVAEGDTKDVEIKF
ncbi:MAG: LemA family protein [Candidatus Omnitrophota bacterium]|nr:LemA family protein [Candidatus Omnitrophota bacterium]